MEREPELVWNKHSLLDEEFSSAAEENMMAGINFNETDTIGNESTHYEKFLLDDFDNYVDEINDRLTVSRLVTDSVIKGIVNAVVEETAEKNALKEAEIARLKEKLRESNYIAAAVDSFEPSLVVSENLSRLKISVENQVKRLKEDFDCARNSNSIGLNNICSANKVTCKFLSQVRADEKFHLLGERIEYLREMLVGIFDEIDNVFRSMKVSAMEQRWEHELHEEIRTVLVQNFVRDIREDCETKILEQRKMMNALNTNYQQKVSELSSLRDNLDAISKSLTNSDQSLLFSHSSSESLEELNNIRWKDQFHVKVISHNGENGATMMQEHQELEKPMVEITDFPHLKHLSKEDLANYYKTEMIKMRRQHDKAMEEKTDELFRLKREFLKEKDSLLSKKDKELEQSKKNVRRIILNLDNILAEKEMFTVVNDDWDEVCCLKDKINFMYIENQRLQGLLIGKRKEVGFLSAQVTDATSQISLNMSINQNLSEQIAKLKGNLEDLNIEVAIKEEMDDIILNEVFSEHNLQLEDAEIEAKLIHDLYSVFVKESTRNEVFMINAITQQKDEVDVINQELDILRDQVSKQKLIISGNKIHSDFMRSQFDEALQQLTVYELEIGCLNQKLAIASSSLEESERQKAILNDIIKDRENKLPYPIMGENMQEVKQTEVIVSLWKRLLEVSLDFESKLAGNIKRNESRLRVLSNQCSSLKQHVNLLLKKGFWYKRMFEIRNSNLQKAEAEVDLLGDEVDALLSVLGKVYVALDHYSPVLQHYPGVMEILKLVRRELQGETATSSSISIAF